MAFYCQNMLDMALILCEYDQMYEEIAFKFAQHFMWIAYAMDRLASITTRCGMSRTASSTICCGSRRPGDALEGEIAGRAVAAVRVHGGRGGFRDALSEAGGDDHSVSQAPSRVGLACRPTDAGFIGYKERRLLSILNQKKLERVLAYMLDENEFLGPHGIRSLSRYHLEHPFVFHVGGQEYTVQYLPAESNTACSGQLQLARPCGCR
jgi:hypothetical protein